MAIPRLTELMIGLAHTPQFGDTIILFNHISLFKARHKPARRP
jgi:hypothetical protein